MLRIDASSDTNTRLTMRSIPTAIDSDAEDVIWALQTADTLWKRQERIDAIVWLRRAAQAAGEAEDDDRALQLARDAAELAEWIAQNPGALAGARLTPTPAPPAAGDAVDDLMRDPPDEPDGIEPGDPTPVLAHEVVLTTPPVMAEEEVAFTVPPPSVPRSLPPRPGVPSAPRLRAPSAPPRSPVPPAPSSPMRAAVPRSPVPPAPLSAPMRTASPRSSMPSAPALRVPTAAEAHAGMLDPWSDPESPTAPRQVAAPAPPAAPALPAAAAFESDEVVTSAPPVSARFDEPRAAGGPVPPPLPPSRPEPPPPRVQPPPLPVEAASPEPTSPEPAAPVPDNGVDLSQVEALSDLPDDARAAFAGAAKVQTLAREDEVSGFALALVLEGTVDVSATIVDAAAQRMGPGAVLRSRGTIEQFSPVRLIAASESARVATWDEHAVTDAFRTCPWVEDELRAAGDRLQALVGITMGPLGDRLDPGLRADLMSRLQLRTLAEHEVITTRGSATVGLLVVGGGELELLGEDGMPNGTVLRPGEFLFPSESLRAAPAPSTVRASRGGALVLLAERGVAQELLVTCPPLLEIFAGM